MNDLIKIYLPKESVSDDTYKLCNIFVENGQLVDENDILFSIESSKNTFDIESPGSGYIFFEHAENTELKVGDLIGVISKESVLPKDFFKKSASESKSQKETNEKTDISESKFSKPALQLIEKHNIKPDVFKYLSLVKKEDVLDYLSKSKKKEAKGTSEVTLKSSGSQKIIIIGGGGHAKMCIDVLKQMNTFEIIGVADGNLDLIGTKILDIPVICSDSEEDLKKILRQGVPFAINAIAGVGVRMNLKLREQVFNKLKRLGFYIPNIIHPKASIEPSVVMGEGNHVFAGAIIGSAAVIGNNCVINTNSNVCHDSVLFDNVHIAPNSVIAGNVTVKSNSIIGMGATVFFKVTIGENVIINNGVNVFKDVEDDTIIRE
ncbi:MAG: NeuD/PglB/VioB family sugar acetyltransferase [Bacteroidales bacterium]|nr:NeuD/PglB/VioB family sugar acetyltransferase [Bacteroidales bacterium]